MQHRSSITCTSRAVPWITSGTAHGVCCAPIAALPVSSLTFNYLPNNPTGKAKAAINNKDFNGTCPVAAPSRKISVTAVAAQNALPGGTLVYNSRTNNGGKLHDPTAILYVRTNDIDAATGKLKAGVPIEPLVLRANAGDCIEVTLFNKLPVDVPDLAGWNTLPMIVEGFNANQVKPSNQVGLHPQLVGL